MTTILYTVGIVVFGGFAVIVFCALIVGARRDNSQGKGEDKCS